MNRLNYKDGRDGEIIQWRKPGALSNCVEQSTRRISVLTELYTEDRTLRRLKLRMINASRMFTWNCWFLRNPHLLRHLHHSSTTQDLWNTGFIRNDRCYHITKTKKQGENVHGKKEIGWVQWLTPVIPALTEAEAGGSLEVQVMDALKQTSFTKAVT
ncbi:hypothetical protein AAY473_014996 [Plecturocebus cupreus]